MVRFSVLIFTALLAVSGCVSTTTPIGPDGQPLPKVYNIRPGDSSKIQFRMFDSINSLRGAAGLQPVQFDSYLNAAAATHARDMSVQNRPWHFGSDGSSPIDRARRVGFTGQFIGENISETFETEMETLAAWMNDATTRRVILAPEATKMGFAWFQEPGGKIWWALEMGN